LFAVNVQRFTEPTAYVEDANVADKPASIVVDDDPVTTAFAVVHEPASASLEPSAYLRQRN
jgi:hypothetical protein